MENTDFAFGIYGQNNPIRIIYKAADFMKNIFNDDDFSSTLEGKRGTHSIKHVATKRARRWGCSKDETDMISCWKQRSQQDSYADKILPWPDEKVADALFKGGPIHYQVRADSGI